MIKKTSRQQRGFTLIEVMVALVVVSLSLGAVAASVSQMVDAAFSMQERTYASWIGLNRIAELRLENVLPKVSETRDEIEYAGLEWSLETNISETGVENLFRVDIAVSHAGSDDVVRTISGFIGEPVLEGASNRAWSVSNQQVGEEK